MAVLISKRLGIHSQGTVATGGGGIIYQPTSGYFGAVHDIKFNNTAAYHLTVSIFRAATSTLVELYYFELDAGDLVQDPSQYELHEGDYLHAKSNVGATSFTISGTELYEQTTVIPT